MDSPTDQVDPSSAEPTKPAETVDPAADDLIDDTLVEEISIDGMCGVY